MWCIIPHTRTKISRTRVHTGTRQTDGFFFWDVSIRNSLRSNQLETRFARIKRETAPRVFQIKCGLFRSGTVRRGFYRFLPNREPNRTVRSQTSPHPYQNSKPKSAFTDFLPNPEPHRTVRFSKTLKSAPHRRLLCSAYGISSMYF